MYRGTHTWYWLEWNAISSYTTYIYNYTLYIRLEGKEFGDWGVVRNKHWQFLKKGKSIYCFLICLLISLSVDHSENDSKSYLTLQTNKYIQVEGRMRPEMLLEHLEKIEFMWLMSKVSLLLRMTLSTFRVFLWIRLESINTIGCLVIVIIYYCFWSSIRLFSLHQPFRHVVPFVVYYIVNLLDVVVVTGMTWLVSSANLKTDVLIKQLVK